MPYSKGQLSNLNYLLKSMGFQVYYECLCYGLDSRNRIGGLVLPAQQSIFNRRYGGLANESE